MGMGGAQHAPPEGSSDRALNGTRDGGQALIGRLAECSEAWEDVKAAFRFDWVLCQPISHHEISRGLAVESFPRIGFGAADCESVLCLTQSLFPRGMSFQRKINKKNNAQKHTE